MNLNSLDLAYANAARDILLKQYQKNISTYEIAKEVGIHESKLKRLFKREFNMGIYEFQLKLRMEKAKEYLGQEDIPVKEVAGLVGYKRHSSFTKIFTKHFGISPISWVSKKNNVLDLNGK